MPRLIRQSGGILINLWLAGRKHSPEWSSWSWHWGSVMNDITRDARDGRDCWLAILTTHGCMAGCPGQPYHCQLDWPVAKFPAKQPRSNLQQYVPNLHQQGLNQNSPGQLEPSLYHRSHHHVHPSQSSIPRRGISWSAQDPWQFFLNGISCL